MSSSPDSADGPGRTHVAGLAPDQPVPLGSTGVEVSRLGLGTAFLDKAGPRDDDATAVVAAALDAGVRYVDTAPLYGRGYAERIIGRALAGRSRHDVTLSTKVGRMLRPRQQGSTGVVFDFSAAAAVRSLEGSLARLGIDWVDIALVHDPDDHYEQAIAGAFAALRRLRSEGVVKAIGAGVNHAWLAARVVRDADPDCLLVAGRYTLLDQRALDELLPLCQERGVALIVGSVFNSGILADPTEGALFDYAPASREVIARAWRLTEVCARHEVPLKAAALRFPLGHPTIAAVLSGCRSVAEVEENLALLRRPVPRGLWEDLRAEGLVRSDAPWPDV